ncbi:hypothetical protein [Streptomyces canus]|uniref:Uncharacterized protein n=1 Tax=Streptomyces canus TaxID=58343 RepID=A0AAW8FVB7_9ACTN|nr:hypothetical protein [Streptomyces canus]MDQ0758259.1 hypothetical protein [Streptomyces canus]MDQ0912997.1 hypothetical protein [Streptomyces canus]MDQ1072984.1 hypothetical protein [Streptomyces canus]
MRWKKEMYTDLALRDGVPLACAGTDRLRAGLTGALPGLAD